ncbi:MFS transporter, partial [Streptomyces sp. NRRL F-5123]|uniref:MFS transporter n=1 Tax=Streptomyces sp. NRRL F-5123 TaxID=1463856 RepID=UPI0004E0C947
MSPVTSSAPRSPAAAGPGARPAPQEPAGLGASLWSVNFRLYFTARSVAMLGDTMLPVALSAGLLSYGYSAGDIGLVMAATTACFAGFVIFGGVIADRFDARRMMIGADLARVCTQSTAAVLFLTHSVRLWEVLLIGVVNGTCAALFQPGVASTVVRVARDVQGANAVTRAAESGASLAGPALAGVLVGFTSAGAVFVVHATTYLTSALCLLALRLPRTGARAREGAGKGAPGGFRADLAEGWREFRARTWMWSVILVWTVYTMCVMGPFVPLAAGQIIPEHGAGAYGLMNSALGAGTAAGALTAMRLRADRPLRAGSFGIFAFALMPAAVGLDLPLPWLCVCVFTAGIGGAFWGVNWATSVQTQVPNEILNRIHAYEVAGSVAMLPVGQALAGPAASALGARHVLQAGGVVAVGVAVTLLSIPAVRGLRRAR